MKKFTKGCAVDVRGWDELPYGEIMFNTICKVGDGLTTGRFGKFSQINESNSVLFILNDGKVGDGEYCFDEYLDGYNLLTPTDILGPELVKAIEEGYTPWFEGDERPEGLIEVVLRNGVKPKPALSCDLIWINGYIEHDIIAYKPIEQLSIESKTLSEKVGNHNHYFKDVNHLETVDVYRVIDLFEVTNPCHAHAVKKILCCGQRGAKDAAKDTQEAIDSLKRALEMMREDDAVK